MNDSKRQAMESRVMVLFGIINQLTTTRSEKIFASLDITRSQLSLLVHFSHDPKRRWTVTGLAEVMEMNQPGITKVVKQLVDRQSLDVFPDQHDSRIKHIGITPAGLDCFRSTMTVFQPGISEMFIEWSESELQQLKTLLEKHKNWLDENRLI